MNNHDMSIPKIAVFLLVIFLILFGIYRFVLSLEITAQVAKKDFTVSYSPSTVFMQEGKADNAEVNIALIPLEGFNESVIFAVGDVLQNEESIKGKNILYAEFLTEKLEGNNFSDGVLLKVTSTDKIAKGSYAITYTAKSPSVEKIFIVPVVVR